MGHPPKTTPGLGDPLDFMRTVWAVDHALAGLSRMMENRLGLSGPQRLVVRVVGRAPGIAPSALAALLHLDPSTLSGHLNTLERKGILVRKRAKTDARRFSLTLTAEGRRMDVAMPGTLEAAVAELARHFPADALSLTQHVLDHLARSLTHQMESVSHDTDKKRAIGGTARTSARARTRTR